MYLLNGNSVPDAALMVDVGSSFVMTFYVKASTGAAFNSIPVTGIVCGNERVVTKETNSAG